METNHEQLPEKLADFLKDGFGRRYQPGIHDCITFIARWADAVSGSSHLKEFSGAYQTKFQGLGKFVTTSVNDAIAVRLRKAGWMELGPATEWQIGDIILMDQDQPGIWHGKTIVAQLVGAAGHAYLHRRHAERRFRWVR